ncbi:MULTISPECIES: GTP cyclohydrolase FolE2 [Halobacteriovorax]|uniref:GTP cyclohydrolase I FolE2 n=1 Tax=Halobacteriovorax vibrionivorans TaxID=2152716 RepID=A0ABY0IJX2_9BACT|nr:MULTISPECIES: GTP cyclohydrolase FolE2 [Halobacteriovorax]AYF45328.1 type I GTP cyclohydrolase folE2 [Halobacteriovorax sp. BALOs_7]RZF22413.1 GTP cyclohydrolase I FolE2 [Halobacteriovorax vibrionivorans]TGD47604.1 GTP cyclohydrolase I FolE2 [Halobacteriovorax sp. Y22]
MKNIEALRNSSEDILNCQIKDDTGLNDFQKTANDVHIAIPKVGIERFRIPLNFEHRDGSVRSTDAQASMFVFLEAHKTGANMSRFCNILQAEGLEKNVNNEFFATVLRRYRTDLRDYDTEPLIPQAHLTLDFNYPVKQQSLKSGNWGWQYYNVSMEGIEGRDGIPYINLTLKYEYSSTCPCSLSMSKQYEEQYRNGETTEGSGIASAHSQRSVATITVKYKAESKFHVEDLIELMRIALPTETQSLVKRLDEQAFAILNGDNPMFVEHSTRRISEVLNSEKEILDWQAKVEHLESLHSHNAVGYIRKEHPKA